MSLADAPMRVRQALASEIRRLLAARGIDGDLVQLQVSLPTAAAAAREPAPAPPPPPPPAATPGAVEATAAAGPNAPASPAGIDGCPPNTVRRVVCEFRNGRFMCAERCVPI